VGIVDEPPVLGPYTDLDSAIDSLRRFAEPLTHDDCLEFGLVSRRAGAQEEVFVKAPKYVQVWTSTLAPVRGVLRDAGIPEPPTFAFVDEGPMVSVPIRGTAGSTATFPVLEAIRTRFAMLPGR
jgi:hypothetical protein